MQYTRILRKRHLISGLLNKNQGREVAIKAFFRRLFKKKAQSYPFLDADVWPWERTRGRIRPGDYHEMVKAYSSWVYACASKNASTCAQRQGKASL